MYYSTYKQQQKEKAYKSIIGALVMAVIILFFLLVLGLVGTQDLNDEIKMNETFIKANKQGGR